MRWPDTHAARFHFNIPGVETGNEGKRNRKPNRFHPAAWLVFSQITRPKETGWKPPLETRAHFNGGVSSALVSTTGLACPPPCAYNERMKTLTITEGRGRLGYWLKKAAQGADVGFMFEGKIVALRPVEVVSADYALQEYGLTPDEMAAAEKRIGAEIKSARKRGEVSKFTGGKNDFR